MTFNLDTLKTELLDYLAAEGFAVFRGEPGAVDGLPTILWDTESHPDYQSYINVAKTAGAAIIVFAHRELDAEEIDDAIEQLQDCDFPRDERAAIERTLSELRAFIGSTCRIEMAFDHQGRMYVYEVATEWFRTFVDLSELLMSTSSTGGDDDEEDETDSSFGGYYSKN